MKRRSSPALSLPAAPGAPPPEAGPEAVAVERRDPLLRLRDRIAADGPARRRRWLPRFGSPLLWLLDEPLLFGAVLVAVLLLGLALGARLFHTSDERRLIVPTVVVQTNPPLQATAPAIRSAPSLPPFATEAPTAAATPAPAVRPVASAPATAPLKAAATAAPADVPPPAAGPSLNSVVSGAARQSAPAGVPPPASGAPAGAAARPVAGAGSAAGSAATPSQPPDLDAAFQRVVTQGQRAATAAAERGPAPAPARPVPPQPTVQP